MKCLFALLVFVALLHLAICRPKKASKVEKTKEKTKHNVISKKSSLKPEHGKTQKGTKKQMLGGLGGEGGGDQPVEGLGGGTFGGGGLGGEMEGMPTGMGAGAEPLGFGNGGGAPIGQLGGAIPGLANPTAEDGRFEDGPRGTPIGLTGLNSAQQNPEEGLEGGNEAPIGRLGPDFEGQEKLNVNGPSLASFAPGMGGGPQDYTGENPQFNTLPSGNMVSPVINGPIEEGMNPPQPAIGNAELQDNQLLEPGEQQDVSQEAASIAKNNFNDNAEIGAAIKEINRVTAAKDAMGQPGQAMNLENVNLKAIQSITSAESAELQQNSNSNPAQIKDVEATSMTGGQVMMGVQGGMKRHNLKKGKTTKKSKASKKKSS